MAASDRRRGLYVAFNRAIADDAREKFGYNVECRTAHSLAYREIANLGFGEDRMSRNLTSRLLPGLTGPKWFGKKQFRSLVVMTIRRYFQSDDDRVIARHVPFLNMIERDDYRELEHVATEAAERVVDRMLQVDGDLPLGHDGYLKLWALRRPRLAADFLLLDEAQDLNPVLVGVAERQANTQLVCVGDSHQQIYQWRGAVDALERLPGDLLRLTQSFRFGGEIANLADAVLEQIGERVPLRGLESVRDEVVECLETPPDAILCRTNGGVMSNVLRLLENERSVYVPGGTNDLSMMIDDADRLQEGNAPVSPDLIGFTAWREVVEFAESDEGRHLRPLVRAIERYGTRRLRNAVARIEIAPTPGTVTVSTCHKAKGLEWDAVEINEDFHCEDPDLAERRLFYVACTRARRRLACWREIELPFVTERKEDGREESTTGDPARAA